MYCAFGNRYLTDVPRFISRFLSFLLQTQVAARRTAVNKCGQTVAKSRKEDNNLCQRSLRIPRKLAWILLSKNDCLVRHRRCGRSDHPLERKLVAEGRKGVTNGEG